MAQPLPPFRTDAAGIRWSSIAQYQPAGLETSEFPWFAAGDFEKLPPRAIQGGGGGDAGPNYLFAGPFWQLKGFARYGGLVASAWFPYWLTAPGDHAAYISPPPSGYADRTDIAGFPFITLSPGQWQIDQPFSGEAAAAVLALAQNGGLRSNNALTAGDFEQDDLPQWFIFGIKTAAKNRTDLIYFRVGDWYVPWVYQPLQRYWNTNDTTLQDVVLPAAMLALAIATGGPWAAFTNIAGRVSSNVIENPYLAAVAKVGIGAGVQTLAESVTTDYAAQAATSSGAGTVDFSSEVPFESGFYEVPSAADYWSGAGMSVPDVVTIEPPPDISFSDVNIAATQWPDAGTTVASDQASSFFGSVIDKAADVLGNVDIPKLVTSLAQAYATIRATQTQTGRTLALPSAGTIRTLPDGTRVRVNPDGSTTVLSPDGTSRIIGTNGQVVSGPSALISRSDNTGVVIAAGAAVLIGAMFALRR